MDQHIETGKQVVTTAASLTVIGTIAGWLPPLAALFAILWYCVLFYDRFALKRRNSDGAQ